jgi:DNA-binding MarR family transcriptional regulator
MQRDPIDDVVEQWQSQLPLLDPLPMAVVGRILRLAGHLERRANEALKPFDLAIWGFDVLGTLRRSGPPFSMTPTELLRSVMLTSGAMTNRIDRLESQGLVEREPDPDDRRSLQVRLTPKGLKVVDQAAALRFQEAKAALDDLTPRQEQLLASLLRRMLLGIEP